MDRPKVRTYVVAFNLSKLFTLKQVIVNPNWYSEPAIEADTLNSRINV